MTFTEPLGQGLKTPGTSLEHGIFMGTLSFHQLTLGTHGGMFFPHKNSFHTSQGLFYLIFTRYKGHHVPQEHLSEWGWSHLVPGFWKYRGE